MVAAIVSLICLRYLDATPQATVQAVVDALNAKGYKAMFSRFEGAKVDLAAAKVESTLAKQSLPRIKITSSSFFVTGDNSTGHAHIEMESTDPKNRMPAIEEDVTLHKSGDDWKIVANKDHKGQFFNELYQIGRNPETMGSQVQPAGRTVVISNLKQLALGVIMFSNDSNDKIAFTQASMKAKLQPYLKNDKLWKTADGKPLDVRINPALVGKLMTEVAEPATCVLLSIGPKGYLQFFDDRTPVAFVDGHVKLLSREQAALLKWH